MIPIVQSDDGIISVSIQPNPLQVGMSESFTIGVFCDPLQPMKSFECCLSYDPNYLSVTEIREGDMFAGFETFFSNGTIDNHHGEVTLVYGLILGPGNVSTSGNLIWIDFQAKTSSGLTTITLFDVGVTNEVEYLPLSVSHGSIDIQGMAPSIDSVDVYFSDPFDADPLFGWFRVHGTIIDDNIDEGYLIITYPDGTSSNITMNQMTSDLFLSNVSCKGHGTYSYHLFVKDNSGNQVSSSPSSFVIPPNWDVTMEGYASVLDLSHISNLIGQTGSPGWVREDVNNNGLVSLSDLVLVSNYYNMYW